MSFAEGGPDRGPLSGVTVVEAATYLSGPFAGLMLADLGADVVKIEQPLGGDPFRNFGRPPTYVSAVFASCNRGKRSVVLDLKDPAGRDELLGLLAGADVFLCNWRAGVADSLGLDDVTLTRANPRLVRCFITGYGPTGPLAAEPAFDTVVQALSGLSDALSPDGRPRLIAGYPVDKLTATMATQAIVAALFARERTGTGERIELSMLDATTYLDFPDLFTSRVFTDDEPEVAQNRQAVALRPVQAADGWLVLAPVAGRQIRAACRAVGYEEWGDELLAERDQATMVAAMYDRIESATLTMTVADAIARLRAADVPCAPCLSMDDHLADEQVAHNGIYRVEEWPGAGRVRSVRYPATFSTWGRPAAPGTAPRLGADTAELLGNEPE